MYNKESSQNINKNLSTEWTVGFTQDQSNINLLNIYNNPSIECPADFTQGYKKQINNSLSTEWHMDLTQDQTNLSLPNVYNNSFIKWSEGFSQDQTNNNIPIAIEWFTNNNSFMEWDTGFTSYQTSTSLLNTYNNSIIILSTGITQNDENQIDCNSFIEWTTCFTQDQTNTSLLNIYNARHCEEQINTLQHDTKSIKKNEHPVSLVSRRKRNSNPKCKKCNLKKDHYDVNPNLCKNCYRASLRILSGNKLIDDFIESTQTFYSNCRPESKLEFILYKQFTNIEYLAKGGFSVIYKATWVDGPIDRWVFKQEKYKWHNNYNVVLKILNNSEKIDSDYLDELKNFFHCKKSDNNTLNSRLHQYLGITQHPETKNYIIVIEFAQNRDLHYFLNRKNTLSWPAKLQFLHKISIRLNLVHQNKIIHRDLHSGNILIGRNRYGPEVGPMIADFEISKPINELSDKNAIYGVIPYVAQEVLKGGKFTQASDIYSFSMIIWEVISGCRPFSDRKHDEYLILDILNGLRPKIPSNIPQDLIELMETCWHQDPEKRKFANPEKRKLTVQEKGSLSWYKLKKLKAKLKSEKINGGLANALGELIKKADKGEIKFLENIDTNILPPKINDQAIYSSRSLTQFISKALTLQ
ncbi:5951_t:CDS:2, partial [Racocetra fulgida]